MVLLIFIFGVLLALGLFFIMADLLKLPRLATQRAMLSVGRQEKKQARSVEALLMGWAVKLAPHIHMDEYKRGRLKNTLAAAGLGTTPEEYTAFAMENVPLHYVLGRYNPTVGEEHYGFRGVVPYFSEDKELAEHYLREAEMMWDMEMGQEQSPFM